MKMFIPEIGTVIKLEKDWELTLVPEKRNESLYKRLGIMEELQYYTFDYCEIYNIEIIVGAVTHKITDLVFRFNMPFDEALDEYILRVISKKYGSRITIKIRDKKQYPNLVINKKVEVITKSIGSICVTYDYDISYEHIRAIISKDTLLQVDRIYIRKGLSDFSSLSFVSKDSPNVLFKPKNKMTSIEKKNHPSFGPIRFLSKLSDVNDIEFSIIE